MALWTNTGNNNAPPTSLSYGMPFPGVRNKMRMSLNVRDDGKWIAIIGKDDGYLIGAYYNVTTHTWISDATVVNGCSGTDHRSMATVEMAYNLRGDNKWVLIVSNNRCEWWGYYWDSIGNIWILDNTIVSGLNDDGYRGSPAMAQNLHPSYEWILINGNDNGSYTGYYWDVTHWVSNDTLVNGLVDKGSLSSPVIGYNILGDGKWFLITGENSSKMDIYGFTWNGTNLWVENTDLVDGYLDGLKSESFPALAEGFGDTGKWGLFVDSQPTGGHQSYLGPYIEYIISGVTRDNDLNILPSVSIEAVGTSTYNTTSAEDGTYSITVNSDEYIVTASKSGYLDDIESVDVRYGNQTQNFVLLKPVISGNVTNSLGQNLEGVTISFIDTTDYETDTDSDGDYSQIVDPDIYNTIASLLGNTDQSESVDATLSNQTQDFMFPITIAPYDKAIRLKSRYLLED